MMPRPKAEVDLADLSAKVKLLPLDAESCPDYELDELVHEGDQLFGDRDFVGAIELYSRCVAQKRQNSGAFEATDSRKRTLVLAYSKRSESWLWLQKHENALNDAVQALELDPTHQKSLFCKGRALHALEQYQHACACFRAALRHAPNDVEMQNALANCKISYAQSHHGVYDLEDFLLAGCQGPAPSCSDYLGPVEIQYVPYAGRGLVVTKDVKAGRLLLVSNALAVACSPTEFWAETRITKANHDFLVTELEDQVKNSKKRMAHLCTLASDPHEEMDIPAMDIFLPERDWTSADAASNVVDSSRIGGIVRTNAFDAIKCIDPIPFGDIETESNSGPGAGIAASGIWVLPSFINHSCASNCNMMFIGKAMFIRASCDIAAGEQLTLSYCDPFEPEEYRQDSLKWWKFHCKCERCLLEQTFLPEAPSGTIFSSFSSIFGKAVSEQPLMTIFRSHCKLVESGQLPQLPSIVDAVEDLIESSASKMEARLQNWLRAPFIEAYTACILVNMNDIPEKIAAIERALDIMMALRGGDIVTMQLSSTLLRDTKQTHGEQHEQYRKTEDRVLQVCRAALGEHSKEFFLGFIAARLHSGNQAFG